MRLRATESGKGWTMHLGAAEDVLTGSLLGRILDRTSRGIRVATDPPYGAKSYPTDVDGGVVVRVLRSLAGMTATSSSIRSLARARRGVAAVRLGRRFVGVEKDPKHFATAVARLREAA